MNLILLLNREGVALVMAEERAVDDEWLNITAARPRVRVLHSKSCNFAKGRALDNGYQATTDDQSVASATGSMRMRPCEGCACVCVCVRGVCGVR